MFPGFVTLYKDKDNFINLYFYPGISDENEIIYKPLELTDNIKYEKTIFNDNSTIIKFYNKNIKSISCKLLSYNDIENNIKLYI
jgi:hypothetical protein